MKFLNINLVLLVIFIISGCNYNKFVNTIAKDKNLYVIKTNGKIVQITNTGKDSEPLISPDKKVVYFIRHIEKLDEFSNEEANKLAIMQIDLNSLKEEKLTDTIYYEDWNLTSELYEVTGFSLSQDGRYIFFITQKWATSGVLVKLNIQTRQISEISHGDKFELLKKGKYKDHIIVYRSSIKNNIGRQWSNWLIKINGKEIKEIGDDNDLSYFKLK